MSKNKPSSVANKASIVAVMGSTGAGKSTYVKQSLARANPRRLIIWDPMREYNKLAMVGGVHTALNDLVAACEKNSKFRVTFRPSPDDKVRAQQFNVVCALAYALGDLTFVVEELRFVTTPSRAPLRWAECTLTGRHKGLRIIGTSQRPASIDKDFLSNATLIRTGLLTFPDDVKAVADCMQVSREDVAALLPLEWIEKDKQTGARRNGRITF